jgi:hypothetical protein
MGGTRAKVPLKMVMTTPPSQSPPVLANPACAKSRRIGFFDLAAELRNKIYDHVIQETGVKVVRTSKSQWEQVRSRNPQTRPRRPRDRLVGVPIGKPVSYGLLMACRESHHEAMALIYSRTTFRFESAPALKCFMQQCPLAGVQNIQKLAIAYQEYGEPFWERDTDWKFRYDRSWYDALEMVKVNAASLKDLTVEWHIFGKLRQLTRLENWAAPLMNLGERQLDRVVVELVEKPRNPKNAEQRARKKLKVARWTDPTMKWTISDGQCEITFGPDRPRAAIISGGMERGRAVVHFVEQGHEAGKVKEVAWKLEDAMTNKEGRKRRHKERAPVKAKRTLRVVMPHHKEVNTRAARNTRGTGLDGFTRALPVGSFR